MIATSYPGALTAPASAPLFERRLVLLAIAISGFLSFLLQQSGFGDVVRRLVLPDSDDVMRLVEVRDLVAGQGWFDTVQHRYLAAGAPMHWSRLVDLPLAAAIAGLAPFVGRALAEGLVAALWPPALFAAFLAVTWFGTRRLFGFRAACFASLIGGKLALGSLFVFGRIDHHNVQALCMVAVALNLAAPSPAARQALAAGLVAAFSLAVGLETLPFVALLGVALALAWILDPRQAAALAAFGGALAVGTLAFFFAQTSPALWFVPECDALSGPWLLVASGGGAGAACLALASSRLDSFKSRLMAAGGLATLLVLAFLALFPRCTAGPWVDLPEAARTGWLDHVIEVMPLWRVVVSSPAAGLGIIVPMLAAIGAALIAVTGATPERRRPFWIIAAYTALGAILSVAHIRGFYVGSVLVPVIGGWAFDRAAAALTLDGAMRLSLRARLVRLAGALLFLSPVTVVPVAALQSAFGRSDELKPLQKVGDCADPGRLAALDAAPPGLVLGPVDLGPSLLLSTHHRIIAAPYHRNGDGIVAGLEATTGSAEQVRAALGRFRPDYLLVCRDWAQSQSADAAAPPSLAQSLAAGGSVPWLAEAPFVSGGLQFWRIRPEAWRH